MRLNNVEKLKECELMDAVKFEAVKNKDVPVSFIPSVSQPWHERTDEILWGLVHEPWQCYPMNRATFSRISARWSCIFYDSCSLLLFNHRFILLIHF